MNRKKNRRFLYALAFLQGMVFYGPVATLYRQAAGISVWQIAQIESVSFILCIVLELPWGVVADRIGYRKTLLIGCGVFFLSKIVFWRAETFGGFLLERALLAVAVSGLSGVDTGLLYLSCEPEGAHRAFSIHQNYATAGLLLAAGVYSFWIGDDYRLAGFLTVVSYGAAALLALCVAEVRPPKGKQGGQGAAFLSIVKGAWKDKRTLALLLAAALLGETHQMITVFLNQLQYVNAGMTSRQIGWVYIAVTLAGLSGGFSARLTRRFRERRTGGWLLAGSAMACAVLAVTRLAWTSIAAMLVMRICHSLFQPLQNELQNRRITTADRATALSLNALLMEGVGAGTNLGFGATAQASLPLAMGLGAALCLTAMMLFRIAVPEKESPSSATGSE